MRQNIVEITLTMKTKLCGWVVKFEKQRQISFHAILLTRVWKNKKKRENTKDGNRYAVF